MAHIDGDPLTDVTPAWFITAVDGLSEGTLRVQFVGDCCGDGPDAEQRLIAGVARGDWDLGWVGTRAFAGAGVDALAPLTAPFLIDSYTLEKAVLKSPVAGRMAAAVSRAHVDGLTLMPGLLQRPITSDAALLTRADWDGVRFQVSPSERSAEAVAALGARPAQLGARERDDRLADGGLRGLEGALTTQTREPRVPDPRIALNEVLSPRISALIAAPGKVKAEDAEVLRRAAGTIISRTGELAKVDADAVTAICAAGGRFALAAPEDLASIVFATRGVLAAVADAEPFPGQLEAIRDLKHTTAPEPLPRVPDSCRD